MQFNTCFWRFFAKSGLTVGAYTEGAFGTPANIEDSSKFKSLGSLL